MPTKYAEGTAVSAEKSQAQIKELLRKYGAEKFAQLEDEVTVGYVFVLRAGTPEEIRIRYRMVLPASHEEEIATRGINQHLRKTVTETERKKRHQNEVNRRWRALHLGIKGKLILVDEEIESIEEAFWAHVMTPAGTTVYEETQPLIIQAARTGKLPALLPGLDRPQLEGKA